jgi:hypothetical protein
VRYSSWIVLCIGLGTGTFATLSACTDLFTPIDENAFNGNDGDDGEGGLNEDGGLDDPDAPTDLAVTILSPEDYLTGPPGVSGNFNGTIACPFEERPCSARWELSSGQTSDNTNLGQVSFPTAGYYRGTLTARGRSDAAVAASVHVTAWNKSFFDDFNRPSLDLFQHGWRLPTLDEDHPDAGSFLYAIESNWVRITGDTTAPGSSALLAFPRVQNGKGTFKQKRTTPLTGDHYTDLVLRYDPMQKDGHFYRVRLHEYDEQGGMSRGEVAELAIFRIVRADNQHGHLMNNRGYYWENPAIGDAGTPTGNDAGVQSPDIVGYIYPPGPIQDSPDDQCHPSNGHPSGNPSLPPGDPGCPTVGLPDRTIIDAFRLEVQAQGNVITFKLYGYKQPAGAERLLLADKITDTAPDAITGSGLWGMAHFMGTSYMDDFKLDSFDP